ncbi:MAG: cation:proton antiporter [Candidatus Aureabacteria bacterium]|nr:cation:proton antiporter [Candidatus Auribacterota bacterium]
MHHIIEDIGTIIIIAAAVGLISFRFKQPILLGYLITGVIVGPIGCKLIENQVNIEIISEIGLILLLFITGLELHIASLIRAGKRLLTAGIGQFVLCVLLGIPFFLVLFGKNNTMNILYLSLLCALSSTAIVVKALNDKFELDTLHGQFSVGILIIQDLWAILILAFQPNFNHFDFRIIGLAVIKSTLLVTFAFFFSKYVLKKICASVHHSPEMVLSISIGWCALVSWLAGLLGLSIEMGALIAGISISSFPYSIHITAKTQPLRDFFLVLFFVSLGMKITRPDETIIYYSLLLTLFIMTTRFISLIPIMMMQGSGPRTAFITSLNLSQISEFSLVIALIGIQLKHIDQKILDILIYTMAASSILSSYFIKYNYTIYGWVESFLKKNKWIKFLEEHHIKPQKESCPILLLGMHRGGRAIINILEDTCPELLKKIRVIDFNMELIRELKTRHIEAVFGDISHTDTLQHADIANAQIIISSIPDVLLKGTNNYSLVRNCKTLNPKARVIATGDGEEQEEILIHAGADAVVSPHDLAGRFIVDYITKISDEFEE